MGDLWRKMVFKPIQDQAGVNQMICVFRRRAEEEGKEVTVLTLGDTLRLKDLKCEKAWQIPGSARRSVWLKLRDFREESMRRVEG